MAGLAFAFDPSKGETQESLKRRREVAQAMLEAGAQPARNLGEGIASFGNSFFGGLAENRVRSKADENTRMVMDAMKSLPANADITSPEVQQILPYADDNTKLVINAMTGRAEKAQDRAAKREDWKTQWDTESAFKAQQAELDRQATLRAAQVRAYSGAADAAPMAVMTPDGPRYVPRSQAVGMQPYSARNGGASLPVAMQKAEDADLEAVDLARNISADVNAQRAALERGDFSVSPMSKAAYAIGGAIGMGGPETAAYNSFRSTLEKMRNDSLRLNKGVQTEGDAQRAWNEIFSALGSNDMGTVSNRLSEIEKINARAAAEAQRRVDIRRQRNGADGFDWQAYTPMGSPLAGEQGQMPQQTGAAPQPAAEAIPQGVDPALWQHMTPEERALWK